MPKEPLDYAGPEAQVKRPMPVVLKWVLIVVGLVAGTAVLFIYLALHYFESLGPLGP